MQNQAFYVECITHVVTIVTTLCFLAASRGGLPFLFATEAALRSAQEQSSHWEHCVHDLFNGLLLNARMNARYEVKVSKMLERALTKLENIESVRYVKCSFPSVASEAPQMKLIQWESLDSSQWEIRFAPCWQRL